MKPLYAQWIIDVYNQLNSFEGEKIILAGWKASGISDPLTKGLAAFSVGSNDPFYDPFDQEEVDFDILSVINCASEGYVEKERVFAATKMMVMTLNSYPGPLEVMTQQKKKIMKRLRKIKLNLM